MLTVQKPCWGHTHTWCPLKNGYEELVQGREERGLGRMSSNRREGLGQGETGELALFRSAGSPPIRGGEERGSGVLCILFVSF